MSICIIWIGEDIIPQKYLPRIQSIFINAYIKGYKCIIYDLTPFTPLEALRASTVARAAADPGILIFFNPVEPPDRRSISAKRAAVRVIYLK